jgi:hypothetical protein
VLIALLSVFFGAAMKVSYYETVEVEGTATIDISDITTALLELLSDAERSVDNAEHIAREKQFAMSNFVNALHQCMEAITDDMIKASSDKLRQGFTESLRHHAERWCVR